MVEACGPAGLLDRDNLVAVGTGRLDNLGGAVRLLPGHPPLRTLGRLDQLAHPSGAISAADHEALAQERIAQPEQRADVVSLTHPIKNHLDWQARPRPERVSIGLVVAQLGRGQRPADGAGGVDDQSVKAGRGWNAGLQRAAPTKRHHLTTPRRQMWSWSVLSASRPDQRAA